MKVLLGHDDIQARVVEMGREIARDYAGREPHLVGVLKGATLPSPGSWPAKVTFTL